MNRNLDALDKYLQDLFKKRGYPGMVVCIRGPEGLIYDKGFGYRSIEKKLPINGDTIFGIGSMSKTFTALACCILHVEGKLRLDDSISKFIPEFHISGVPDECMTIRNFAMHRSGIPPMKPMEWSIAMNSIERETEWYRYMRETSPNQMDKDEQVIDYIMQQDYKLLGAPGEYMSYLNEGFVLLTVVVERASGMPLEKYLTETIFKPVGMTRSILDIDASHAKEMASGNITSLFDRLDNDEYVWDDNWSFFPPFRGAACVKSTTHDLSKFYLMLDNKGKCNGKQVIPAEAIELLCGRQFPLQAEPYYCMGLWKSNIHGEQLLEHCGALRGISCQAGVIEGKYSIAVFCNEGNLGLDEFVWPCYNFIMGLPLTEKHYWAMPSGDSYSEPEILCGDYISNESLPSHIIVSIEDGNLVADFDGLKVDLLFCSESIFAVVDHYNHKKRVNTFKFHIRDGKAWGVKCGYRIFQKIEDSYDL